MPLFYTRNGLSFSNTTHKASFCPLKFLNFQCDATDNESLTQTERKHAVSTDEYCQVFQQIKAENLCSAYQKEWFCFKAPRDYFILILTVPTKLQSFAKRIVHSSLSQALAACICQSQKPNIYSSCMTLLQ